MIRALRAALSIWWFCWKHRQADRITIERNAIYDLPDMDNIDFEWMLAQHHAGHADRGDS